MTDKEYFSDKEYLTNTMLGWISVGPKYFKKQLSLMGLDSGEESFYKFGSAVHCRILEPKEFSKRYFVLKAKAPTNAVQKKFCELLTSHNNKSDKSLITAYKLSYSASKMTDEAILKASKALYDEYDGYISEQRKSTGKISLTLSEYDKILAIERNIKTNKRAQELLNPKDGQDHFNEKVILYKFKNVKFKSKLDKFIIDTTNKIITLVDLKTHSSKREDVSLTESFKKAIDNYDYDRQLHVYTAALFGFIIENYPKENLEEYIFKHKIIVARSNFDNDVRIFDIDKTILERGEDKFNKLFKKYLYYEENGYDKDFDLNEEGEELITI